MTRGTTRRRAVLLLYAAVLLCMAGALGCGRAVVGLNEEDSGPAGFDAGTTVDAGDPCSAPIDLVAEAEVTPEGRLRFEGTSPRATSTTQGSCGGGGPELVFQVTPPMSGVLVATTIDPVRSTTYDTVVYVRTTCGDPETELTCIDDSSGSLQSRVRALVEAGVPVFLFVDGAGPSDHGILTLEVELTGLPDAGMPMDDAGASDAGVPDGSTSDGG